MKSLLFAIKKTLSLHISQPANEEENNKMSDCVRNV